MAEEMHELFYRDGYAREFDAKVLRCEKEKKGFAVVLDDTAFYPEGGGQPADQGTLGGVRVTDVKRRGGEIVHYTDGPLPEGASVRGEIDWERRFSHMQNHSGEHIVSGLIHRLFGWDNVGFHMGETVTVDFNGPMTWEAALRVEAAANAVIWENRETEIFFPSPEELAALEYRSKKTLTGAVRIVAFPGADVCACCGTHVRRAGEIGVIKILSLMNHRGGVRLELLCGKAALAYMNGVMENNGEIARLLSVKPRQTAEAVRKEMAAATEERQKLADMSRNYFRLRAAMLPREGIAVDFEEDLSPWALRKGAETLLEEGGAPVYVLLSGGDGCFRYVIAAGKGGARALGQALNKRLRGRGGGSNELVQGQFSAAREEIEAALRETLAEAGL